MVLRASDIYGRKAGASAPPPRQEKEQVTTSSWNPATGRLEEQEVPEDIQELMRGGEPKRPKLDPEPGGFAVGAAEVEIACGAAGAVRILPPPPPPMRTRPPEQPQVFAEEFEPLTYAGTPPEAPYEAPLGQPQAAPVLFGQPELFDAASVEFRGLMKAEMNNIYVERPAQPIHGKPTYWAGDGRYFAYWQDRPRRWAICDVPSLSQVMAGQYPGWAYRDDDRHLSLADGWQEAMSGGAGWRQPELTVTFRSSAHHPAQWSDPETQRFITAVEFSGFAMAQMNTCFYLRANEVYQGQPSYWDISGVYFIYWQQSLCRWAICDSKCVEDVKAGQCPGWAYRSDSTHFANASGWVERNNDAWVPAQVTTGVISRNGRSLIVSLNGFGKPELNSHYAERLGENIQGKPSFWNPSGDFFIYWQSRELRWSICDTASLANAQCGGAPGGACRKDPEHFAECGTWLEFAGADWRDATVFFTVLPGKVPLDMGHSQFGMPQELPLQDEGLEAVGFAEAPGYAAAPPPRPAAAVVVPPPPTPRPPQLCQEDVPEVDPAQYADAIRDVYQRRYPPKLNDMERLMNKYRGRERELYFEVCKKYGEDPANFYYGK